jgi:hypothetical protein
MKQIIEEQLYQRGPHVRYAIMALSIGFGIVVAALGIFITVLSLIG